MLGLPPEEILQVAVAVESIQKKLLQAFFVENPRVADFKFLTDFPKSGVLKVDGEVWAYTKHGLGYSFSNERGHVMDVHNHFGQSHVVDAHRLTEYLLSLKGAPAAFEDLYALVEDGLVALQQRGLVKKIADRPLAWELLLSQPRVSDN